MSDDVATLVQKAVRLALVSDPDLAAAVGDLVLDEVPDNQAPPYLRFGDIEPARDDQDGCLGWTVTLGIEAYSRPGSGRVEAQRLCGLVSAALHRAPEILTVDGFTVWDLESDTYAVTRQGDGKTYQGTVAAVVYLSAT